MVADEGHREGDQGRRRGAAQQPPEREGRERPAAGTGPDGGSRQDGHDGDEPVLSEPVAQRAIDQLAEPVGEGEGRHHEAGIARGPRELACDLRHQRVADPCRRRGAEGGSAQGHDRPAGQGPCVAGGGRLLAPQHRLDPALVRRMPISAIGIPTTTAASIGRNAPRRQSRRAAFARRHPGPQATEAIGPLKDVAQRRARSFSMVSCAALIAASLALASRTNSSGTPLAISRSG